MDHVKRRPTNEAVHAANAAELASIVGATKRLKAQVPPMPPNTGRDYGPVIIQRNVDLDTARRLVADHGWKAMSVGQSEVLVVADRAALDSSNKAHRDNA